MNAGIVAAFLSSCTWAVGISIYARLAADHNGSQVNATRALVAAPLFAVLLLLQAGGPAAAVRAFMAVPPAQIALLMASALSSFALADVLFLRSAVALGVPTALSIASTCPLWAALAGAVIRGERLSGPRLGGVLAVVMGTIL